MAVICFSSLKGGVGKTTLSVSVACAFAERGCETIVIDLDPAEHASRLFASAPDSTSSAVTSPIAKLFLGTKSDDTGDISDGMIDQALLDSIPLIRQVRPRFAVLPAGPELRHFLWGRGARAFKRLFPRLIEELHSTYDYIVIDTPPDYNVLTRNALAVADLCVVPIDSSIMSIHCLEKLFASSSHIKKPTWSIIRTMVSRQASRVREMSNRRLEERLALSQRRDWDDDDEVFFENAGDIDLDDADGLIAMFDRKEASYGGAECYREAALNANDKAAVKHDDRPIYLLNSVVYRTEDQNKLTFLGKTAFDLRATAKLAEQYLGVARELEQILSYVAQDDALDLPDDILPQAMEQLQGLDRRWNSTKMRSGSTC